MANALKTLRAGKQWTHDEAADHMGISRGHFIKLERGERKLTEHTIDLAARAFEVSPAEVLGETSGIEAGVLHEAPPNFTPPPEFLGARDLKVFAAVVNPRLSPMRNADVILIAAGEEHGQFTATIKRLLGWNEREWKLRQFNPKKDFTLSRREWPKALRVVGKFYGR